LTPDDKTFQFIAAITTTKKALPERYWEE
jgi:hypothetical protein